MKTIVIAVLFSLLVGCVPAKVTFLRPTGDYGFATIDGCAQVPDSFKYEKGNAYYSIKVFHESLVLSIEALDGDLVAWSDRRATVTIDGVKTSYEANDLKKYNYTRGPYRMHTLVINIPNVESSKVVLVQPPEPMINSEPIKTSLIKFRRVTETLFQAINC